MWLGIILWIYLRNTSLRFYDEYTKHPSWLQMHLTYKYSPNGLDKRLLVCETFTRCLVQRFSAVFFGMSVQTSQRVDAYSPSSGFVSKADLQMAKWSQRDIFLFPTARKEFAQFLQEALVFGPSGGVESAWKVKYISPIRLSTDHSLWVASSVPERGKQKGCWGTMLETLKLLLLQPLLSSTKRSWRPMTVGCIRWCLLQGAQRKKGG